MAATCPLALTFFFCCILLETISCSGAFVKLSYDSTKVKILSSSVITEFRVVVTEKQHAYLFLKPFECRRKPCRPEHLAGSFVNEVLDPNRHLNVSNIIVMANERQLGALRRTLQSIHAYLGAVGLGKSVKVSPELLQSSLRIMAKNRAQKKQWGKVMEFVRRSGSFIQLGIEAEANSELALDAEIQEVVALLSADAGVVLHLKSRAAPSAEAMANLVGEINREKRLLGVLVDVSSPRRELGEARATAHDEFSPVTNPATMPVTNPVTVPATNPVSNPMSPGFVTVPSTNPGNGFSTNPNLPPLYPEPTTPVTMPDPTTMPPATVPTPFASPVTAPTMPGPVTNPAAPVSNPATTPTQFPGTSPVTNPVTTYPYPPQQGGGAGAGGMPTTPVYQPPATMPGTVQPGAPTVAGQTWCVAKTGLTDLELQNGIDYACGIGQADCSAIQPMGACYNPNILQAHASYAFNSYFQRNPSPTSCDFGGAGMLVNVNPSSGTCMYQTSAGFGAGYSPGATGTAPTGYTPGMSGAVPGGYSPGWTGSVGGGSGSTVLNANNPGGNSMYGSDNPTGLTAGSASLSCGWVLCLIWMVTFAFVKKKV
ncbi:transcriptional regulatory protein AlgP-like [Panicum miliaceum]|uniref:Transcriptional regulatory protein AlgP-like n=1 Tax=Panicum miliaceum TaxID=4540 RepID=A0A3L6S8Y2_PANMI|nr:transcriptional regulatory protein AlgP-like [Panicum miliaceum]